MTVLLAILLFVILIASWPCTLVGLPGNWFMTAATAVYVWLVPAQSRVALGWKTVVILLVLAISGEVAELLAGALGAKKAGGSRRGAIMALGGSLVGGIAGIFIGLPIPVIGSVVAAVLFAALGAMVGAILGETSHGRDFDDTWRIAKMAFWGRIAGTFAKMWIGAIMIVVVALAMIF